MKQIDKTIAALGDACLRHHHFDLFTSDTRGALSAAYGSEVIWLTGPSRVGKTTGTNEVRLELDPLSAKGSKRVTMRIAVRNTSRNGAFSTKSFTQQMLAAIEHPFFGKPGPDDPSGIKLARLIHRTSEAELQMAMQLALVDLEIKYLFIDEAQHLLHLPGGLRNVSAVLDSWKGLAEEADITLLFSGAYPLIHLLPSNSHLVGRSEFIHFPRYQLDRPSDLDHFAALVAAVDTIIGYEAFMPHLKLVFNESLGCAGLLLRLVRSTLPRAQHRTNGKITKELIQYCSRSEAARESLLAEIHEGESLLGYTSKPIQSLKPSKKGKKSAKPFQTATKSHQMGGRL